MSHTISGECKRARIAAMNDAFRESGAGGRIVATIGITTLSTLLQARIVERVRTFADFHDPDGERDFGAFWEGGVRVVWKIDYYDHTLEHGSEDPSDASVTTRVLTIMRAEEH